MIPGLRLERNRHVRPPLLGLLTALLVALGALLGAHESFTSPFAPLDVAMFLTLATALWGCQAAAAASAPGARELLAARTADEWVIHLARVLVIGFTGGLLSLVFTLSALLPQAAGLPAWLPALRWVPHLFLAHAASAALGAAAGLLLHRTPTAGVLAAGGLWVLAVWAAVPLGPAGPDPLLRALQWDAVLHDGAAEPIYGALAFSLLGLTLAAMFAGLGGFTLLERRRLAPAVGPFRVAAWAFASLIALAAPAGAGWRIHAAEAVLAAPPPLSSNGQLLWQPEERRLLLTGPAGEKQIWGPVRPSAVALSGRRFEPYVGRRGAVVPLSVLTGSGSYDLRVVLPAGWELHGCGEAVPLPGGQAACRGEATEDDWLLLLPADAMEAASALHRTLDPQQAEARALFEQTLSAAFGELGLPMPEVAYIAAGPRWLSPRLLLGRPNSSPEPAISRRQMAHAAALALAQHLSGQRSGGTEHALLPLLATLDRLVWELELLPGDPQPPPGLDLPAEARAEYDRWWHLIDERLTSGQVEATSLWRALAAVGDAGGARRWPEIASRLLAGSPGEG